VRTVASARAVCDLFQREVERELFGARDPVERAKLKEEHAGLRELSARIAEREAELAEARHEVWLREVGEELRLARLFGTRPEIYRKSLSSRQKAALVRRLGREGYLGLPFSMSDRRGAL
jgi:hypothetical protein